MKQKMKKSAIKEAKAKSKVQEEIQMNESVEQIHEEEPKK